MPAAGRVEAPPASIPSAPGRLDLLPSEVRERFRRPASAPELSLVAPVFEEQDNLAPLHERVVEIFGERVSWELILVDDGSRDDSARAIRDLARADPRVVGVFFARNCGQTAAMAAGIQLARAPVIATLDADLQNDPGDLPAMLERLEGHDAVVGYRQRRRDGFVRLASSRIANAVRNRISGDSIRDTGCSLKVFRAGAVRALPLFEGLHRFLPTLLRYHGFAVVEHPVGHAPRLHGHSKYGIGNRACRALKDLFAVRWMRRRRLLLPIVEVTDAD